MVGIKGTGMAALAEILLSRGACITGSDRAEQFYTDAVLQCLGIPYFESFDAGHVEPDVQMVVHSAAYSREENPELAAAIELGIPVLSYPEVLGLLSRDSDASGIAGTHGKTTTAALTGTILRACSVPATVLAGAEVESFGNRSTLTMGERFFVAETCEYRRHFLHFHPQRLVVTNVEMDHPDYFKDLEDVLDAFTSYCMKLPEGGALIYNHDDRGSGEVAERVAKSGREVDLIPYGRSASGPYEIESIRCAAGQTCFELASFSGPIVLQIPGVHSAYNATAAIAVSQQIVARESFETWSGIPESVRAALGSFRGSRRRSEIVGSAKGVLFMDDYGHHPTEISSTLAGLKDFYPGKRIIVDFMPHTYSRTKVLLSEFGTCFSDADMVVLHGIYASARERSDGGVDGTSVFNEVKKNHPSVFYFERAGQAIEFLRDTLQQGDLFVTMGAGDNWKLGRDMLKLLSEDEK